MTTPSAPEVLNTPAPRVVLVDGSSGYRHLISSYLITNWPDAVIEAIDPFSQTMRGPGMAFGATGDVIIIGGIGTGSEAISVLERLRKRSACPPVILLVAQALMAESAALIAAGATGILCKDALSKNSLCQLINACLTSSALEQHDLPLSATAINDHVPACGNFSFVQGHERINLNIEGYRCLASLSSKPMAQVFYAESMRNQERVVIKIPTISPYSDSHGIERFCLRFKFVSSLQGHDVVRYRDAGVVGPWPYVVLEYLAHGDLRSRIKPETPVHQHLKTMLKLAAALTTFHTGGLAHLDLKPENIFFRKQPLSSNNANTSKTTEADDDLVLIDFNISTPFGGMAKIPANAAVLGTPAYMSPEQGQGLAIDGRSDLYSAGVIFYEMLTGEKPYTAQNDAALLFCHIHDEIPLLPKRVRDFQPIIDGLLAKRPDERFVSAADLTAALKPYLLQPFWLQTTLTGAPPTPQAV